jgi:DNA-binding transcriptional LysR family regulator
MPRKVSLSVDLLRTFVTVAQCGGDAAQATRLLGVNQPSMSKRLGYLQHAGRVLEFPWLVREGKTWKLTREGERVLPTVEDLLRRYEQLSQFAAGPRLAGPTLAFGCGQQSAATFVHKAVLRWRSQHGDVRLRITTLRGRARIERVANGLLDLATVTHDEAAIHHIARRPLHVETLISERLALVCTVDSPWASQVEKLRKTKVAAEELLPFPLVLPDAESGIRKIVDRVLGRKGLLPQLNVTLEVGGWSTMLAYVREGIGVGLVSESALQDLEGLLVRLLDAGPFPPIATRLICRRVAGTGEQLDLSPEGLAFRQALLEAARKKG